MVDIETSVSSNELYTVPDEAAEKKTKVDVGSVKENKQSSELQLDKKVAIIAESEVSEVSSFSLTQSVAKISEVENITPMKSMETVEQEKVSELQSPSALHDQSKETLNNEVKLATASIDQNDSSKIDSDIETKLTDVETIILAHESLLEMGRKVGLVLSSNQVRLLLSI